MKVENSEKKLPTPSTPNTNVVSSALNKSYSYFVMLKELLPSLSISNRLSSIAHLSGWTPLGMVPSMLKSDNGALDVIHEAAKLADQHSSKMGYFWADSNNIVILSPEHLKQVFITHNDKLMRADGSPIAKYAGQATFFLPDGELWKEGRKIWKHYLLEANSIQEYHPTLKACIKSKLSEINALRESNQSVNLQDFITDITLEMAQHSLIKNQLDLKKASKRWQMFTDDAHWLIGTARGQLYVKLQSYLEPLHLSSAFQGVSGLKQKLEKDLYDEYMQRKGNAHTLIDDINSLSKKHENPALIFNEIGFLLEALHENTIKACCFLIKLINDHPEVERKLREELNNKLDGDIENWTYEQINDLPYLNSIFAEMLRLHPTAPVYLRTVMEPFKLGDIDLEVGDVILVPTFYIHRMKAYWGDDADVFKPERFYNNPKNPPPYAYMPFSEGPRMCVGRNFARYEILLLLATLYRENHLAVQNKNDFSYTWKILLAFDKPTYMKIEPANQPNLSADQTYRP
jgi:cytochrome P450